MTSPVKLGVYPAATSTPTGVFTQWFEALFPCTGTLGFEVCHSVYQLLPHQPAAAFPTPLHNLHLAGSTSYHLAMILSAQLPVSTPPTILDEWFFFISLVVELPYSSIFHQFWLIFVFKLLLSFFWVCGEAQCVYLCLHLGWKSLQGLF